MMKCYKIRTLFGSYIYNTITSDEKAEVDTHVKTCEKCAEDLKTQQKTLEMIKMPVSINENDLYLDEERFMRNVYRRIALESIKRKSRQVTLWKYVFQPAMATAVIVFVVAFSIGRFNNIDSPENSIIPSTATTELPAITDLAKTKQNDVHKESANLNKTKLMTVAKRAENAKKQPVNVKLSKPDTLLADAIISNSRDWLMNADLINYSLGEPRKALSRYQMIIDHYPDTDAAKEAQKRIKTIIDSEFEHQQEEITLETGSDSGI